MSVAGRRHAQDDAAGGSQTLISLEWWVVQGRRRGKGAGASWKGVEGQGTGVRGRGAWGVSRGWQGDAAGRGGWALDVKRRLREAGDGGLICFVMAGMAQRWAAPIA